MRRRPRARPRWAPRGCCRGAWARCPARGRSWKALETGKLGLDVDDDDGQWEDADCTRWPLAEGVGLTTGLEAQLGDLAALYPLKFGLGVDAGADVDAFEGADGAEWLLTEALG